jgi:alpha-beta hydrolase superfamily lysophospholipase
MLRRTVLAALVLSLGGAAACLPASWGASAILHPGRRAGLTAPSLPHEEIAFDGEGVRLRGWRFAAEGTRRGTVIYLHGVADNRSGVAGIAARYTARGFDVLAYDSRAHGLSEGEACTYGFYEKRDLRRVLDTVAPGPVALLGVSLGGSVALQAAADDPRISAVVAIAPFATLESVVRERAPFFVTDGDIRRALALAERQARFEVDEVNPQAAAARITVPVLLIHGDQDEHTSADHSRRIYGALTGKRRLIIVPAGTHYGGIGKDAWKSIDDWIEASSPKAEP